LGACEEPERCLRESLRGGQLRLDPHHASLAETVCEDITAVSPETEVRVHEIDLRDAWDFEEVYGVIQDFARSYPFDPEREGYLLHITTGTHVSQICMFLLAEARYFPAACCRRRRRRGSA
jgi:transcriptional regulatory protein RtcR